MPDRYTRRLITHLRHASYEPAGIDRLAHDFGIEDDDLPDFREAIKTLVDDGRAETDKKGRLMLPGVPDEVIGIFKANARGFGFLVPEEKYREGDLFVPAGETCNALTGDKVRAAVVTQRRRGEEEVIGIVEEILERKQSTFAGTLRKQGSSWLVQPDGRIMTNPIVVTDPGAKNANEGDKVVVDIVHYPEGNTLAEGVIRRVLGEAGEPSVETQAVIATFNLPGEFPEECHEQAREATAMFHAEVERAEATETDGAPAFEGREDLRSTLTMTIDPPDARDYDDAISLSRTRDGWELAVHIADVATFVQPDSALDVEAYQRGNSCYLPRLVIPMLPEILSNGICSLAEDVIRYVKTAFISYDKHGRVTAEGVASCVIRSDKRMTYLEAQALIDGNEEEARKHAKTDTPYTDEMKTCLKEMDRLARAIRERRRKAGMIHLDLPDAELVFNDDGHVVDVEPEDDAFTHTIIEMMMVEANEVVARLFTRLGVPHMRRIHPEPVPGDKDDLGAAVRVAGYTLPKNPTRQELQSILDSTAGTPAAPAIHMACLRSLTKAEYSPADIGHYALASDAYSHFTSPIRRYPDLTIHRNLATYLSLTNNGQDGPTTEETQLRLGKRIMDEELVPSDMDLREVGSHCSSTEVNAASAERDLRQYMVLRFLQDREPQDYDAIVTGVSPRQIFVQVQKYLADGAVKTEDLPQDGKWGGRWRVDSRSGALVNQNSGRSFSMGDKISVRIANIDLELRRMDLVLADANARKAVGKTKNLGGGLGEGGLKIDLDQIKGKDGATKRAQRSKSRDKRKADFRKDRKDKGKRS